MRNIKWLVLASCCGVMTGCHRPSGGEFGLDWPYRSIDFATADGGPGNPHDGGIVDGGPGHQPDGGPGNPHDGGIVDGGPGHPPDGGIVDGGPGHPLDGGPGHPLDGGIVDGGPGHPPDGGPGHPLDGGIVDGGPGHPPDGGPIDGGPGASPFSGDWLVEEATLTVARGPTCKAKSAALLDEPLAIRADARGGLVVDFIGCTLGYAAAGSDAHLAPRPQVCDLARPALHGVEIDDADLTLLASNVLRLSLHGAVHIGNGDCQVHINSAFAVKQP